MFANSAIIVFGALRVKSSRAGGRFISIRYSVPYIWEEGQIWVFLPGTYIQIVLYLVSQYYFSAPKF